MVQSDRNLLFGILAVQMNFVSRDALIAGMNAWVLAQHRALGRILVEQGSLTAARHDLLERLVDEHRAVHERDAEESRAAAANLGAIPTAPTAAEPSPVEPTVSRAGPAGPVTLPGYDSTVAAGGELAGPNGSRFRVLRPHARGGLGQVSVALDRELNREVALKEIRTEHADNTESRERFLLEAEITGRLEHPGVVPVYGLGCDPLGRPFYAMRLVKGQSLKEAIERFHPTETGGTGGDPRRWNLELRQLLNRLVAVSNVVAYAHARGIIHRDLKPSNILLGPYGETLVVDWGLAKVVGRVDPAAPSASTEGTLRPASSSGSTETLPGLALGTPSYMSPEQAEGRLDEISPLSDVYSLGATLYALLTGRPPFDDRDIGLVLRLVRDGKAVAPRRINRRIPAGVEAICLKAMALHPRDRYPSTRALADDLDRWLADEPVSVYREPLSTRLTRWGRRHRILATGVGVLLVAAVAGLSLGTILLGRANDRTERQRALAEDQRRLAELKSREARDKAEILERHLYVNRINLAQREALNDIAGAERLLDQCPAALRGWEWDHIKHSCHLERRTLRGHTRSVNALAFSPDGRWVISGAGERFYGGLMTHDAELTLWDLPGLQSVRRLSGLKGAVFSAAFSPDGKVIAVGSGYQRSTNIFEGHLSVWDAGSGRLIYDRMEPGHQLQSVAFSPDGRSIAAGYGRYSSNEPGQLKVWEAAGGRERHTIAAPPGGVNSLAFSPDGRRLALACSEVVELWEWDPAPRKAGAIRGHTGWIYSVAFSPDGTRLATGGWDKTLKVWDTSSGTLLLTGEGHNSFITGLAFRPDGKRLATASEDHTVRVWDTTTGQALSTLRGHTLGVTGLAYSPDGATIATRSEDRLVKLWDAAIESPIVFRGQKGWVTSLAFSPDGRRIVSGSGDHTVLLWDPATGRRLEALGPHGEWINGLAFSPDGKLIAAVALEHPIRLWDVAGPRVLEALGIPVGFPFGVAFSPDGRRLAVGTGAPGVMFDQAGVVRIWEMPGGRELLTYRGHAGGVFRLAFSPDGKLVASVGGDRRTSTAEARLWDAATGREIRTLVGHTNIIRAVAFSPDGSILATGGDTTARLWDVATGRPLHTLGGHSQEVECLAFSPDGRRLATGGFDSVIKLWEAATGEEVLTLRGHSAGVTSLAFSPDGRRLVSGSVDWTARVWDATAPEDSIPGGPPDAER